MQSLARIFLLAGIFALTATVSRGESEIVVAIRYLQAKDTSHSHLYLYREDGKLLRQLTKDNSGQDMDPIFAPDGETIVFTRQKSHDTREFWSIDPRGTKLKKLDAAPDWYTAAKSSPYFTNREEGEEQSPSASPAASQQEFTPPAVTTESTEQRQQPSMTAIDATANAKDRPPETIKAPDGSGEIFWRKGEDKEDSLDWIMWFRDSKSGQETKIGKLRGFPSFEPLQIRQSKDGQFLFDAPLRLIFFQLPLGQQRWRHGRGFRFQQAKARPVITKLGNPNSASWRGRVSHAHRKSLCRNSRQFKDGELFLHGTLGRGYEREVLRGARASVLRRRARSALRAQRQCCDLLWRVDVSTWKKSRGCYDSPQGGFGIVGHGFQ